MSLSKLTQILGAAAMGVGGIKEDSLPFSKFQQAALLQSRLKFSLQMVARVADSSVC
jgi:hypothetical protein